MLAAAEEAYFCVGADVKDLPVNMWHAVPGLGVELDKPVIAATSGWVVGGGFVLVQMADMCVASETTRFIYPEVKIGTTAGGVSSVVSRMPHKIAMEFLLVGEEMSAERLGGGVVGPRGQERDHVVISDGLHRGYRLGSGWWGRTNRLHAVPRHRARPGRAPQGRAPPPGTTARTCRLAPDPPHLGQRVPLDHGSIV